MPKEMFIPTGNSVVAFLMKMNLAIPMNLRFDTGIWAL